MALVSMKMTPAEAKEDAGLLSSEPSELPEYPYGLTIYLCDDSLQKLGMAAMPAVGTEMTLTAKVVVTSTSSRQTQAGGSDQDVGLQITDMALGAGGAPKSAADTLYGS